MRQLRISGAFGAIRISQGHSGNISLPFCNSAGEYIQVPRKTPHQRRLFPLRISRLFLSVKPSPLPGRRPPARPREESPSSVRRLKDGKAGRNARSSSLSDSW